MNTPQTSNFDAVSYVCQVAERGVRKWLVSLVKNLTSTYNPCICMHILPFAEMNTFVVALVCVKGTRLIHFWTYFLICSRG